MHFELHPPPAAKTERDVVPDRPLELRLERRVLSVS